MEEVKRGTNQQESEQEAIGEGAVVDKLDREGKERNE